MIRNSSRKVQKVKEIYFHLWEAHISYILGIVDVISVHQFPLWNFTTAGQVYFEHHQRKFNIFHPWIAWFHSNKQQLIFFKFPIYLPYISSLTEIICEFVIELKTFAGFSDLRKLLQRSNVSWYFNFICDLVYTSDIFLALQIQIL